MGGQVTAVGGNLRSAGTADEREGEIAKRGHDLRGGTAAQARAILAKGHVTQPMAALDLPAADVPGHDLGGGHVLVGTKESERAEALLRAAHQDPADGQGVQAGAVPEGGAGRQVHLLGPAAVPGHRRRCPHGRGVRDTRGAARLARPFLGLGAALARGLRQRRVVERGVGAQARTEGDGVPAGPAGLAQAHGGVATVTDKHDLPLRLPAPHQTDQHVGAVHRRAMPLALFLARRGSERGDTEQRQGPGTRAPRHRDQHHQANPAQPGARHRRAARRAHRVAEAPRPGDRAAPASLQRVVDEQHQRCPVGQEGRAQQVSRVRLSARADHGARVSTRWSVVKWCSWAKPIARRAAATVRAPGARMVP